MIKRIKITFIFSVLLLQSFCQLTEFKLNVTDTSALDFVLNLSTDEQIIEKYSKQFIKLPKTDTTWVLKCVDCQERKVFLSTRYEIQLNSLKITCITYGVEQANKVINKIIINAISPTNTNLDNFVLGKTMVKEVEKKYSPNVTNKWFLLLFLDDERKYLYFQKSKSNPSFYFGTKRTSEKVQKNQIVDRILIGND